VGSGETSWRLKATEGHGWIEHVHRDGAIAVTANPLQARQFDSQERAEAALARLRPGVVPFRAVAGPAFDRRVHGAPR
jgi:hypothetical protein